MALDLKADVLYQYATDVATWQMDRIECHMKRHPGDYPIFTEGLQRADHYKIRIQVCAQYGGQSDYSTQAERTWRGGVF